jgi:hypothetical protein
MSRISDENSRARSHHPRYSRRIDMTPIDALGEALVRCALLGLLFFSSPGMAATYPWEEEPASRWTRDFSNSARDNRVPSLRQNSTKKKSVKRPRSMIFSIVGF